jgi:glycosyltransferase involved in cell wall biosynthesis
MKVFFPFVGDSIGGSYITVVRLIKALAHSSVEPLVALHRPGVLAKYLDDVQVPYVFLPQSKYLTAHKPRKVIRQFFTIAPPLARFLREYNVDIVHVNDNRMYWTWPVPTLLARKKFLLHLRTLTNEAHHPIHRKLMFKAHSIICDSEQVWNSLQPEHRVHATVIRSAIDWNRAIPNRIDARVQMQLRLGCAEGTAVIGFFANFIERKRPLMFVEVAACLARAYPGPVVFVMFGEDRDQFAQAVRTLAAERGIAKQLHIMGFDAAVEARMAGCDLLIVPAVREPLGLTLLEGCCVGTPVVAADDAGHREIFGTVLPEWLARPDDPAAFCKAALAIFRNPQKSRVMLARARTKLATKFDIVRYASAVEQQYRDLLSHRLYGK